MNRLGSGHELTDFERRVYAALRRVPRGRVISYGALARAVGCNSPRAIGQALRRNPFAPDVPCHRVIAADGTLGGFQGKSAGPALLRKLALLSREGVRFKDGRLADPARLIREPSVIERLHGTAENRAHGQTARRPFRRGREKSRAALATYIRRPLRSMKRD